MRTCLVQHPFDPWTGDAYLYHTPLPSIPEFLTRSYDRFDSLRESFEHHALLSFPRAGDPESASFANLRSVVGGRFLQCQSRLLTVPMATTSPNLLRARDNLNTLLIAAGRSREQLFLDLHIPGDTLESEEPSILRYVDTAPEPRQLDFSVSDFWEPLHCAAPVVPTLDTLSPSPPVVIDIDDLPDTETYDYSTPSGLEHVVSWLLDHYRASRRNHWVLAGITTDLLDYGQLTQYLALWHASNSQSQVLGAVEEEYPEAKDILTTPEVDNIFAVSIEIITHKDVLHTLFAEPLVLEQVNLPEMQAEIDLLTRSMHTHPDWYAPGDYRDLTTLKQTLRLD